MNGIIRRVRGVVGGGGYRPGGDSGRVVAPFHELYYGSEAQTWKNTYWLGVPVSKCPLDLWVYQEIISEVKPGLIVETGTYRGGSALFMATVCDAVGAGRILTIDIEELSARPEHPRVRYLLGSSTSEEVKREVAQEALANGPVLVILDSDHSAAHVLAELEAYAPLVSPGSYLVVEDTNVNGHPVLADFGPGPMEAVEAFLRENEEFVIDSLREKFMLSFNPKGFLRRVFPAASAGMV